MNNVFSVSVNQFLQMSVTELDNLLLANVVDLRFVRKAPVKNKPPVRRMLCTKNSALLNSNNGLISLGYRAPVYAPKYNPAAEGLVIAWDILMQDFRNIWAETTTIVRVIPPNDDFWKYFNTDLYIMTPAQKLQFMAS